MGRLDLPDKYVDWVAVTKEFLNELYDEIAALRRDNRRLTHEVEEMEDQVGTLLGQLSFKDIKRQRRAA